MVPFRVVVTEFDSFVISLGRTRGDNGFEYPYSIVNRFLGANPNITIPETLPSLVVIDTCTVGYPRESSRSAALMACIVDSTDVMFNFDREKGE